MVFLFFFLVIFLMYARLERKERRKKLRQKNLLAPSNATVGSSLLTEFGDGMHEVGVDIAPGTYRSLGRAPLETMWQRVSDFSGTEEAVIGCGVVRGPCIVTIAETDRGFESVNSGGWKRTS